jgi:FAD/FMN-containing dehydrogenase
VALAGLGAQLGTDVTLDRSAFRHLGAPREASMTVDVGVAHTLAEVEAHLAPSGLSLGPVSPADSAVSVAAFLEGPLSGLRAVAGGRLEPLCTRLEVLLPSGEQLTTSTAPRSAAGPELGALVLGGEGRLGLILGATLRCGPRPTATATLAYQVPDAATAVDSVRRLLGRGGLPSEARLLGQPLLVALSWAGSLAGVERERALALRLVAELHTPVIPEPAPSKATGQGEREATWAAVEQALRAGASLTLRRLSLASVVVEGEVEGLALDGSAPWHPVPALLRPLGARVLGGAR